MLNIKKQNKDLNELSQKKKNEDLLHLVLIG